MFLFLLGLRVIKLNSIYPDVPDVSTIKPFVSNQILWQQASSKALTGDAILKIRFQPASWLSKTPWFFTTYLYLRAPLLLGENAPIKLLS